MSIGPYQTTKTLGSGAFGVVKLATKKGSDREYAIKCISKQSIVRNRMGNQVMKEISIMKKLKHEYIVTIEDILMSEQFVYISMEYASGGELWDKVTLGGKLTEKECKRYTWQMCTALEYCHSHNVCHRDIKPQNILLDKNDNVKLADFGFASIMEVEELKKGLGTSRGFMGNERLITIDEELQRTDTDVDEFEMSMVTSSKQTKTMSTFCGTVSYMAPEIERQDKYFGDKADVWSLGIVVYVLLNGFMPFKENDTRKNKYNTRRMTKDSKDFVSNMLEVSPIKRWTMQQLLQHAWLEGVEGQGQTNANQHERRTSESSGCSREDEDSDEIEKTANDNEVFEFSLSTEHSMSQVISMLQQHSWNVKVVDESNIKISKMDGKMVMVAVTWLQTNKLQVQICNINRLECRLPMIRLRDLLEQK